MGKMIENPRYNIVTVRISDYELAELDIMRKGRKRSHILLEAIQEKIIQERQSRIDAVTREVERP